MSKLNNALDSMAKPFSGIAPWLVKVVFRISFFLHGWAGKFPLPPQKMVVWFESKGIIWPELITSLVALGEVIAGIGIVLGGLLFNQLGNLITRLSGGAVVVIMIGVFAIAHPDWFITKDLFMSEQIFLFILGLYFMIKGNN